MLNVGGAELLIILLVALIFLGPQRLPEAARQLGQAVSSLRSLASGFQAEIEAASKPARGPSMTLDGPTDQSEAIAATQDPFAIKQAALEMDVDQAADLTTPDLTTPDLTTPDLTTPDLTAPDLADGDEQE